MTSTIALIFALLFAIAASTSAWTSMRSSRFVNNRMISMGAFDVKKLGQSLIDTTKTVVPGSGSRRIFKSPTIGTGEDDRDLPDEEDNFVTLSKISKSMEQKKLLMRLESDMLGVPEKLERIRLATEMETLPVATSFAADTVSSARLLAGNLADEWDF